MGALQSFVPRGEGNQQTAEFVKAATMGDVDQLLLMLENGQQVDGADVSGMHDDACDNSETSFRNLDLQHYIGVSVMM